MLEGHRIGGLLLMGGSGSRFGSPTPKQFHRLGGKPIFLYTLEAFLSLGHFDEIVLSCHPDWMEWAEELLPPSTSSAIHIVRSGETRQESSRLGLLAFQSLPEIVAIHDAVRPFVSQEILLANLHGALAHDAIDTCIPSRDTLVHAPDGKTIAAIPMRKNYLRGQTPQSFRYSLIREAHLQTKREDVSDDCQLILDLGHPVHIVPGDETNIKITSGLDLTLAEQLLLNRSIYRRTHEQLASLSGRKIAVVGGTGGIGSAICAKIRERGGEAIPLSRRTTPHLDLSSPPSIEEAFREIGPLDGLINSAGILHVEPLQSLSLREIEEMLNVNLRGPILCCKTALLKDGAHVINIASSSFSRGRKDMGIYSSAKAGLMNFTQGWAEERPDLRIHTIIPGRTNTALRRENFPSEDPSTLESPDTVANAVVDLLFEQELTGLFREVRK
jgi:2-C-methyl-D-erythritol 4-phosphate cytidylyltransferase